MQTFKQYLLEQLNYFNAKMVIDTLALYLNANKRSTQLQLAYQLALKHYPQHAYHGTMYRSIRLDLDDKIDYNDRSIKRQLLQRIKDHKSDVYSFTTNQQYAMNPSRRFTCVVVKQTSTGLNVADLVTEQYPKLHDGAAFHNLHPYEQEILATVDPSIEIIAVVKPDSNATPYS